MNTKSPLVHWFLFLLLSITWGSSFILMKRGLEVYSSVQVAALRMFIAFLVMLPFGIYQLKNAGLKTNWKYYALVGVFGNFIPAFLFTLAQTGISSSTAGILNALTPLFTMLLAYFVFKASFSKNQITGLFLGFLGAVILIYSRSGTGLVSEKPSYAWLVVLATFCYGISVNTIKQYLTELNPIAVTALALCAIGPIAGIILFNGDFINVYTTNEQALPALGYITLLSVLGTAAAVVLYNVLIKNTSVIFASSVTYVIPVVALFWGVADGEGINMMQLSSIGIILAGVFLVNYKKA